MDKKLLIAQPINEELEKFNVYYKESISSSNPRIQKVIDYVMKSDGKRIRPILLLLAAKASGEITNGTYNAAITLELLHTASLIHDDVVDESMVRRGKPSVNAVYDNKMAVLAGDYFLSTALMKSILTGNIEIIADVSKLGRNLAEGELNQLSLVNENILDENEYFEVIKKKTASLMAVCMRAGAMSAGGDTERVNNLTELGELLGICFQIKDDIFDYFTDEIGKPTGNDIREGKVTLPLLYALKSGDSTEAESMMAVIRNFDFTDQNVNLLIDFAKRNGGIEYAYNVIEDFKARAVAIIKTIENDEVRGALFHMVDYIVERKY